MGTFIKAFADVAIMWNAAVGIFASDTTCLALAVLLLFFRIVVVKTVDEETIL